MWRSAESTEAEIWLEGIAPDLSEEARQLFDKAVASYYQLPFVTSRDLGPLESLEEDYEAFSTILHGVFTLESPEAVRLQDPGARGELEAWVKAALARELPEG